MRNKREERDPTMRLVVPKKQGRRHLSAQTFLTQTGRTGTSLRGMIPLLNRENGHLSAPRFLPKTEVYPAVLHLYTLRYTQQCYTCTP